MATQLAGGSNQSASAGSDIKVRVRAYLGEDGTVQFEHDWNLPGKPPEKGKVKVPANVAPMIRFKLDDDTKLNLSFYPNPADAFWVNAASQGCPKSAGNGNGAFNLAPSSSSSGGNKLDVLDKNPTAADLLYTLRFDGDPYTDKNGVHPPFEYDPELRNGGGGTRFDTSFGSSALIGLAVVAVIAVTALVRLTRA